MVPLPISPEVKGSSLGLVLVPLVLPGDRGKPQSCDTSVGSCIRFILWHWQWAPNCTCMHTCKQKGPGSGSYNHQSWVRSLRRIHRGRGHLCGRVPRWVGNYLAFGAQGFILGKIKGGENMRLEFWRCLSPGFSAKWTDSHSWHTSS